jgi:two-component system KDP operon response regulator KdpE
VSVKAGPAGAALLVIEDDPELLATLSALLRGHGHRVDQATDVAGALARWEAARPDLILLDLGLPDGDGTVVIRRVRREAATPILVLSARDQEPDKVAALEGGADDYVTKPFGTAELMARIGVLLRRAAGPAGATDGMLRAGRLVMDVPRHRVTVDECEVALTPREFEVLKVLLAHAGRLVTHGRLLRAVWGTAYDEESHYVHVYVSQIRRKLAAADPSGGLRDLIVAEPGVGYRVRADEPAG